MKISFSGIKANAMNSISGRDFMHTENCISAYHDTILALVKGDTDLDEVKDLFFSGKSQEEINEIAYDGGLLTIK